MGTSYEASLGAVREAASPASLIHFTQCCIDRRLTPAILAMSTQLCFPLPRVTMDAVFSQDEGVSHHFTGKKSTNDKYNG